ncbi:hypothetical protein Tco_1385227 [Tanacetum coccineum]
MNSETKDVHAIKYKMSKAKERCMTYFHFLHSHLQVLSNEDLKGTRIEHGFKRAFMSLFSQDDDTFTSTMFLNVDQLQKQLDKDDFQEDPWQPFGQMPHEYFAKYTRIEVKQLRETLLQHMGNVKKPVTEITSHQRHYDRRKAMDQNQKCKMTEVGYRNDTDANGADIKHIYDEEPMAEVQLTAELMTLNNVYLIASFIPLIMEYLVKISKRRVLWSLNEDILKITALTTNTSYPSRKIRRICACTAKTSWNLINNTDPKDQYAILEI